MVLCVNDTSFDEQEKKIELVGDAAVKAGFINTDGLLSAFPHRVVLHVPTQRFALPYTTNVKPIPQQWA